MRLVWILIPVLVFFRLVPAIGQAEGPDFPPYPVEKIAKLKSGVKLPAKLDLSKTRYFPPVIDQHGWSCNQASSIGYMLTYELNRIRDLPANLPENRYPPLYTWNFLNNANYSQGVSYFDTWEIIKAGGCPNYVDFPWADDIITWMSGYDKYYRAMQNRVLENYSLPVGTPEGVNLLKRYLYDHFDGSKYGGTANFQIASGGMAIGYLPEGSIDPGAPVIHSFGTEVGHAMTIVGYNDSLKLDLNGDGRSTNDLDINGDRVVDLHDWEKGAFIVYNTWGNWLSRRGMAYVPYHVLARFGNQGGFWNRTVHIIEVARSFQPILTMRAELSHTNRSQIRIMAGVSNDPGAAVPDKILEFPHFNFQGANHPLEDPARSDRRFEVGLDITPLASYVNRGQPVKFFLIIDEKDSGNREYGKIFSLGIYNFFGVKDSVLLEGFDVPIADNTRTLVGLVRNVDCNKVEVQPVPVKLAKAGDYVSVQLEARGAASPYRWELVHEYDEVYGESAMPEVGGEIIYNINYGNLDNIIRLPFEFTFYGKQYDGVLVTYDGQILFEPQERDYPYAIDTTLVFRSRKRIVPYGQPLDYYMAGNGIRYQASDSVAQFFWQAMAPTDEGPKSVTIACVLHRDGRIAFHYDETRFLHGGRYPFSLGISNGDSRMFKETPVRDMDESINMILFKPARIPLETKLDATGWLFCRPEEENVIYEVRVLARDKFNLTGTGSVFISTMNLDSLPLLSQNYPNPFVRETIIPFVVPVKSKVLLEIFNLKGDIIAVLADGEMEPSLYEVTWNGALPGYRYLPQGVYIVRLMAAGRKETIKVTKLAE
jgi:hypothetical protein